MWRGLVGKPQKVANLVTTRGVARSFEREVTLCQSEGTHQIAMSFRHMLQVVCLKRLTKGEGGTRTPQD